MKKPEKLHTIINNKDNKTTIKLRNYVKEHDEDIIKTLIELFEFQENIKFVNTKIIKLDIAESK